MNLAIETRQPFSFDQTLTFIRRFPPCQTETIVTDDSVTAAVSIDGRAWPFTLRHDHDHDRDRGTGRVTIETPDDAPRSIVRRAADWIGADDDLGALYRVAENDPPFRAVVRALHGLHQVRFLGLEEIAVYCVMMQRTPITMATRYKKKFLDRFGHKVAVGDRTLRAMPELAELATLDADDIADAIGHRVKAERIAVVVRAVAAIGEEYLRTVRYADAKAALLAIPGVGPFSATAILLRGLGRVDDVPSLAMFENEGRAIYGAAWNERAIARRYGDQIGYWSFYVKTGAARLAA